MRVVGPVGFRLILAGDEAHHRAGESRVNRGGEIRQARHLAINNMPLADEFTCLPEVVVRGAADVGGKFLCLEISRERGHDDVETAANRALIK